jgi:actin-related protein
VKVVSSKDRNFLAWIGASIIASNPKTVWVTREEFLESGNSSVLRKKLLL